MELQFHPDQPVTLTILNADPSKATSVETRIASISGRRVRVVCDVVCASGDTRTAGMGWQRDSGRRPRPAAAGQSASARCAPCACSRGSAPNARPLDVAAIAYAYPLYFAPSVLATNGRRKDPGVSFRARLGRTGVAVVRFLPRPGIRSTYENRLAVLRRHRRRARSSGIQHRPAGSRHRRPLAASGIELHLSRNAGRHRRIRQNEAN